MLAKLRLDQTKKYEQALAAYEITVMMVDFVLGREHYIGVGSEQGDISTWDDIVIEKKQDSHIHIQVKRQTSGDFGTDKDECIRNDYSSGDRNGQKRDLSPLDETIKSLADWFEHIDITNISPKKEFWIELPELNTQIKKGLKIKELKDLCEIQIKPSVSTAAGLQAQAAKDPNIKKCFDWLTTWCGFRDWGHVLKTLQFLKIKNSGLESEIEIKTENKLKEIFVYHKLKEARLRILSYTIENTTFSGAIAPRNLLFELQEYIRSDIKIWTQIENLDSKWQISGIHDLENNTDIERPSKTVPLLWSNERVRDLNINLSKVSSPLSSIHESVFRLALHLDGNVSGLCTNWNEWKVCIENKIGGTLGLLENDFEGLRISNNNAPIKVSGGKALNTNAEREAIAKEMDDQMSKRTWELISEKLSFRISQMDISQSQELRDAVETRWESWKKTANQNDSIIAPLLKSIVHPRVEGEEILGCLRIGPKTKLLIADALFTCLLVSIALDQSDSGIMKTEQGLSIGAIGLNWWSGPAGKIKSVRRIDDEESINDLIGKEAYDILVLSQSNQPEVEIYKQSMGESTNFDHSLASGHSPKLLVTRNRLFNSIIKKGSITELRTYLEQKLVSYKVSLTETLNNNAS
jgi:outer membrane lipopolysaccharide assembly protein LptE/RlpB